MDFRGSAVHNSARYKKNVKGNMSQGLFKSEHRPRINKEVDKSFVSSPGFKQCG